MPEYLAPGVYIEETSFRPKTIEGVSTSTTGFVGPTRFGPIDGKPELITSFTQFERIYGGLDQLSFAEPMHNYMAHAVRAFFDNGGSRLYVARTFKEKENGAQADDGIGATPVPAPSAAINMANTAAENLIISARKAVNTAISTTNAAKETAKNVLRAALDHIAAAVPAGVEINFDAVNLEDGDLASVMTDIQDAITALGLTPAEEAPINTAKEEVQNQNADYIERAINVRDATEGITIAATDRRTLIDQVMDQGLTEGDNAQLPTNEAEFQQNVDNAIASAALAATQSQAADQATAAAVASKEAVNIAAQTLTLTDPANRVANIEAAVIAAEAAQANAQAAIDSIDVDANNHAPSAAFSAVRDARLLERAADHLNVGIIRARYPGAAGNLKAVFTPRLGDNVLQSLPQKEVKQVRNLDIVLISRDVGDPDLYLAKLGEDGSWSFENAGGTLTMPDLDPGAGHTVQVCSFTLQIEPPGGFARPLVWTDLTIHQDRRSDGILSLFAETITNRSQELETPVVVTASSDPPSNADVIDLAKGLIGGDNWAALLDPDTPEVPTEFLLTGGNDGERPTAEEYRGSDDTNTGIKNGLVSFEDLEEISIVAAPGLTYGMDVDQAAMDNAIQATQFLITHCEKMAYRVAVIDSGNDQGLSQVREYRAKLDSKHAALYYPWVTILDPITQQRVATPPSGFVTGIYARNDANQGVHKAPANEVPRGAVELETLLNKAQQDVLNPLGVNCLRYFENRGIRVWGARTLSSDPEWKYLNLRRYFAFLERSIEKGTQWVVFENNGQRLWDNVRRTVEDFLFNEWKSGHLMGATSDEAYFVRCDRTTMTQNDFDNGRLICLVGVAPLRPAEFVIFRIGQKLLENSG